MRPTPNLCLEAPILEQRLPCHRSVCTQDDKLVLEGGARHAHRHRGLPPRVARSLRAQLQPLVWVPRSQLGRRAHE